MKNSLEKKDDGQQERFFAKDEKQGSRERETKARRRKRRERKLSQLSTI